MLSIPRHVGGFGVHTPVLAGAPPMEIYSVTVLMSCSSIMQFVAVVFAACKARAQSMSVPFEIPLQQHQACNQTHLYRSHGIHAAGMIPTLSCLRQNTNTMLQCGTSATWAVGSTRQASSAKVEKETAGASELRTDKWLINW